jgi:fructokinase
VLHDFRHARRDDTVSPVKTLCLGEALVDMVCERPAASLLEADCFIPHFGGATANVTVVAARAGGEVALAGGAGQDAWGEWLRERLTAEGVDLTWFALRPGPPTTVAFVAISEAGEPSFLIYGDAIASAVGALGDGLLDAVEACDALFFASNTLVGERERELTMAARERALELGRPVIYDPNVRLGRWPSREEAARAARACVDGAFLLRCNHEEAELLTGESDPDRAVDAILAAGARHVVVTRGPRGAVLRGGGLGADVPGVAARTVDTTGAGDTLMGALIAALGTAGFDPSVLEAALPRAVEAAARATEHFGALE